MGTRSSASTSTADCSAYACSRPKPPIQRHAGATDGADLRDSERRNERVVWSALPRTGAVAAVCPARAARWIRSSCAGALGRAADQPTRARSLTIRRLLVLASRRSIAEATSLRGDSVDQRLPTRWTSPRRSSSCSRASVLSLFRPAARAAIAVENEAGILRSAARRRSGRRSVRRSPAPDFGGESGLGAAGTGGAGSGLRPTGGSSPKRARQLPHTMTGSRPAGRAISNRRHPRPEWQTPQRRPARSISVTSKGSIGFVASTLERRERRPEACRASDLKTHLRLCETANGAVVGHLLENRAPRSR
jgi:hypothetical protein